MWVGILDLNIKTIKNCECSAYGQLWLPTVRYDDLKKFMTKCFEDLAFSGSVNTVVTCCGSWEGKYSIKDFASTNLLHLMAIEQLLRLITPKCHQQ